MVSALDSAGSSGPGSSDPDSTPPTSINGYGELLGKPDEILGVTCDGLAFHPGGLAILLVSFMLRTPG